MNIHGEVVCITGGAKGIGKATAKIFAQYGAEVWIGDIDIEQAQMTANEIGTNVHAFALDVTNPNAFEAFLKAPQRPVRVLVNNAGIMNRGKFQDIPLNAHLRELNIDLSSVIIGTHLVLPEMLKHNKGHIINVASMAGKFTLAGVATYNASKFGVVALSRTIRNEIKHSNVKITTILPSAVRTDLLAGISSKGVPTYTPETIAQEIFNALTHQKPEVSIPKWANLTGIAEQLLPEKVFDGVKKLMGGERLMK